MYRIYYKHIAYNILYELQNDLHINNCMLLNIGVLYMYIFILENKINEAQTALKLFSKEISSHEQKQVSNSNAQTIIYV